jgi:PKD repeat protein
MKARLLPLFIAALLFSLNARPSGPDAAAQQCTAYFIYPTSGNCTGESVLFTDLSYATVAGYITTWEWNFGDGTPVVIINFPNNPSISHIFAGPSTSFTVTLTITGSLGCTDSEVQVVNLTPTPVANFSFPLTGNCTGQAISFTDLSQTNGGGVIVSWDWNFGDGSFHASNQNPVHAYAAPGAYSVTLIVINTNNCPDTVSKVITISSLPVATITPNGPTTFCQGNTVTLTASLANSYLWSNGATIQSITVSSASSYTVTVSNGNGCSSTSPPTVVTVHPNPVANAGTDQTISFGASTTLYGTASGGTGNFSWHWEPASFLVNANVQNPVTQSLTSSLQFTLTVTDIPNGCMGSDPVLVTVTGGPLSVDASASPGSTCPAQAVQLMAITSGGTGNNTYSWTSNPVGFTANTYNPVVFPFVSTMFYVSVNDGFAIVNDSVSVTVLPLPGVPGTPTGPDTVDLITVISSDYQTTGGTSATSYTWELSPENAGTISGTGTTATVVWSANFLGTATINVKSVNSCGESVWTPGKETYVKNTVTGVADEPYRHEPRIYPNPSTGIIQISLPERSEISLFTTSGMKVGLFTRFTSGSLDLSDYKKGVYLLIIESPGLPVIRRKIVLL